MIEKFSERGQAWLNRWLSSLKLAPPSEPLSSAPEFLCGNLILTYALTLLSSIAYFSAAEVINFRSHLKEDILTSFEYASKIIIAYAILLFFALLITASISFLIYRILRRKTAFTSHWEVIVNMTALEPIAGSAIGLYFAAEANDLVKAVAVSLFAITRLAQLVLGYRALVSTETNRIVSVSIYCIGFAVPFLAFCYLFVGVSWLIVASAIVPWWD